MSVEFRPTLAQQAAVSTLGCNLLVNAGAGSGKTRVLVERFVHLLAHPDESGISSVSQIVAITFTIKAAHEMRARVRQALSQRLVEAGDAAGRERWSRHLKELDGARISTIHALAANLLRANAAAVPEGLDPAFEVLNEVQSGLLVNAAVDDVLRDTAADDPALDVFAHYRTEDVVELLRELVLREMPAPPADLLEHWAEVQTRLWEGMRTGLVAGLRDALDFAPPRGIPGSDRLADYWRAAGRALEQLDETPDQWPSVSGLFAGFRSNLGQQAAWGGKAVVEEARQRLLQVKAALSEINERLGGPVTNHPDGPDAQAAALAGCWQSLAKRAQERYAQLKAMRGAVDFDDLERLALALLEQPAVRARYDGAEFRHVMVDEFQDTSATQWAIIQRLANPARPGALFLVGDPKQSIYGFRGADARVFDQARAVVVGHGGQVIALSRSFRTHERLIGQFNGLFGRLFVRDESHPASAFQTAFDDDDRMQAERATRPEDLPAFEFLLADKADAADAEDTGRAREAQAVAGRIRQLADAGCDLGDIALLFRASSGMPEYEEALKDETIPYVTVAGRGYYGRQEVWDVLDLLRALYQRDDALSLATALRSPLFGLSDDALLALRWPAEDGKPRDLWTALADAAVGGLAFFPAGEVPAASFAREVLTDLRAAAGRVPLAELIERALALTGYRAVVSALPDGARRRGNLDKLVAKAIEAGPQSLGAFLTLLDDLTERETREGEAVVDVTGAVRLMTIHAAKGLEFPVVFIADAGRNPSAGRGGMLQIDETLGLTVKLPGDTNAPQSFAWRWAGFMHSEREQAELRRLLYVAATRAEDRLIISGVYGLTKDRTIGSLGGLLGLLHGVIGFDNSLPGVGEAAANFDLFGGPARLTVRHDPAVRGRAEVDGGWPEAGPAPAAPPALLAPVADDLSSVARSMSATTVAELGKDRVMHDPAERAQWARRWRGRVLHAAPEHIDAVAPPGGSFASRRRLGESVHKALRWCSSATSDARLREVLESSLWEQGILPDAAGAQLADEAFRTLRRVLDSDLQKKIEASPSVYRELPFVYQTEKRAIHGVIDVLFRRPDGGWTLVDYKTAFVQDGTDPARLALHARQFHFQLAVYAAAVRDLLALPDLKVYIHYIRHQTEIEIAPEDLEVALRQLEGAIGQMLAEDAPV